MQFLKNIKFITAIRIEQIYRDYVDLNTLLGLVIAGCAGYFFQSRYVATLISDQDAAKFVAMLACIGFTIMVKNLSFRIDENPTWGPWINRYIKVIFGIAIVISLLGFDSYTSNVAIENAGLERTADNIENKIDTSKINEYKTNKTRLEDLFAYYEQREKDFKVSYRTKKCEIADKISEYDRMIADAEKANQKIIADANVLRIATVSTDSDSLKIKSVFFGTSLLLLAFGIEWLSTGTRHERKTAENAIDRIPYAISIQALNLATATVHNKRFSFEVSQTMTETKQEIPADVVNSILKPQNGDQAIELYARGVISSENGWPIRKIAKKFFGNENQRTKVCDLIQAERRRLASNLN